VDESRQRGSAEGTQRKRESHCYSLSARARSFEAVRSAQTYNSVAPTSSASRFVLSVSHTRGQQKKKKCRGSSGREMLLRNKDVVDVNAVLASPLQRPCARKAVLTWTPRRFCTRWSGVQKLPSTSCIPKHPSSAHARGSSGRS
jgi:hypothetical protein